MGWSYIKNVSQWRFLNNGSLSRCFFRQIGKCTVYFLKFLKSLVTIKVSHFCFSNFGMIGGINREVALLMRGV